MKGNLPMPLMDIYNRNSVSHNYLTRNRNNPRSIGAKTSVVRNSFLGLGPLKWDELKNTELSKCNSLSYFVNQYKKRTLNLY